MNYEEILKNELIGNHKYFKAFKDIRYSSLEKLDILYKDLDVRFINKTLYINENRFYKNIPPHDEFWHYISVLVQDIFGEKGLNGGRNSKTTHQFRYYISKHNIEYIRSNYKFNDITDYEALKKYTEKELNGKKTIM